MSTVLFSVISILLLIINNVNSDNCNLKEQTCSNENEHCIFQRANLGYPDPKNFYTINPPAYVKTTDYTCNTQAYCEWAELMNVPCIQIYVPEKFFSSAFPTPDGKCSVIKAPITINETISCCQKNMNCSNVFTNLDGEPLNRSTWAYQNCPLRPDLTEIVEDVVDCYATIEFMKCMITYIYI